MMKRFATIVLTGLTALILAACTEAPLKPAPDMSIPAGVSQAQVKTSIEHALVGRGWTLDKVQDGDILTTLHLRDHAATVHITYDAKAVHIAYVSSSNLNFRQRGSQRYIHRNYNGWITFLEQDIQRNLQNSSVNPGN